MRLYFFLKKNTVATIPSALPHQIVKTRGLFAEARSIRPRNGSNPRLPGLTSGLFCTASGTALTWVRNEQSTRMLNIDI